MDTRSKTPEFNLAIRVYYEDTDAAGVVYHSNYLKFMERARTEWLRAAGYLQRELEKDAGIVFVVSKIQIEFKSPAKFEEDLNVHSVITRSGGSWLEFRQSIYNQADELKCRADVSIVCVDRDEFKPKRIPDGIKARLT